MCDPWDTSKPWTSHSNDTTAPVFDANIVSQLLTGDAAAAAPSSTLGGALNGTAPPCKELPSIRQLGPGCSIARLPHMGSLGDSLHEIRSALPSQAWGPPRMFSSLGYPRLGVGRGIRDRHSDRGVFVCSWPDCNHTSSRREHFKIHMRRHTRERPYRCDHCDYRCNQKGQLKNHLLFKHSIV